MCQAGRCGSLERVVRTNSWLVGLSVVDVKAQRDLRHNLVEFLLRGKGLSEMDATSPAGARCGAI